MIVVWMGVVELVREKKSRLQPAQHPHQRGSRGIVDGDMSVGQLKVLADVEPKNIRRFRRLLRPDLHISARSHLAPGYIQPACLVTKIFQLQHRPANRKFEVVGMSKHGKYVDLHMMNLSAHRRGTQIPIAPIADVSFNHR